MSAGVAFGGGRDPRPVPPEKGVFPLDHLHECDLEKKDYISCLKSSGHESKKCRLFLKKYLECRMEKRVSLDVLLSQRWLGNGTPCSLLNLMARQDMSELGFGKEADLQASREENTPSIDKRSSD